MLVKKKSKARARAQVPVYVLNPVVYDGPKLTDPAAEPEPLRRNLRSFLRQVKEGEASRW
jgi:hypothetical protein